MDDSFANFQKKLDRYKSKYANNPRKAAIGLAWYGLKYALCRRNKSIIKSNSSNIKICFKIYGGIGDFLIAANYIWHFKNFLNIENARIDVCFCGKVNAKVVFEENCLIDSIYKEDCSLDEKFYDLYIKIIRFPEICFVNTDKFQTLAPHILILVNLYNSFKEQNLKLYKCCPDLDGLSAQLSIMTDIKRIQQPDIGGLLKIGRDFKWKMPIRVDEQKTLTKFKLISGDFITINRGVDCTNPNPESTKMWPIQHYNNLTRLLKEKYPQYKIVQIGISAERCGLVDGVDVSLVGKTTMEEVKVLLKHAALHIDGEGGMVHLRRALNGGKSVVLFGPTPLDFYGYDENINIKSNACPHWCEWIANDWQSRCLISKEGHPCLHKLLPDVVMSKIVASNVLK